MSMHNNIEEIGLNEWVEKESKILRSSDKAEKLWAEYSEEYDKEIMYIERMAGHSSISFVDALYIAWLEAQLLR